MSSARVSSLDSTARDEVKQIERSLAVAIRKGKWKDAAANANMIGDMYYNAGDYDMAVRFFEKQLECAENSGELAEELHAHRFCSVACIALHQWDQANEHLEEHRRLSEVLQDKKEIAYAYVNLGFYYSGRYEAISGDEESGNAPCSTSNEILEKALSSYKQASLIADSLNRADKKEILSLSLYNIGINAEFLGKHDEAILAYERLLKIVTSASHPEDYRRALLGLGLVYQSLERFEKSLECFKMLANVSSGDHESLASAYEGIAKNLENLGNELDAVQAWKIMLKHVKVIGNQSAQEEIAERLKYLKLQIEGKLKRKDLLSDLTVYHARGQIRKEAVTLSEICKIEFDLDMIEECERHSLELRILADKLEDSNLSLDVKEYLSKCYMMKGNNSHALTLIDEAVSEILNQGQNIKAFNLLIRFCESIPVEVSNRTILFEKLEKAFSVCTTRILRERATEEIRELLKDWDMKIEELPFGNLILKQNFVTHPRLNVGKAKIVKKAACGKKTISDSEEDDGFIENGNFDSEGIPNNVCFDSNGPGFVNDKTIKAREAILIEDKDSEIPLIMDLSRSTKENLEYIIDQSSLKSVEEKVYAYLELGSRYLRRHDVTRALSLLQEGRGLALPPVLNAKFSQESAKLLQKSSLFESGDDFFLIAYTEASKLGSPLKVAEILYDWSSLLMEWGDDIFSSEDCIISADEKYEIASSKLKEGLGYVDQIFETSSSLLLGVKIKIALGRSLEYLHCYNESLDNLENARKSLSSVDDLNSVLGADCLFTISLTYQSMNKLSTAKRDLETAIDYYEMCGAHDGFVKAELAYAGILMDQRLFSEAKARIVKVEKYVEDNELNSKDYHDLVAGIRSEKNKLDQTLKSVLNLQQEIQYSQRLINSKDRFNALVDVIYDSYSLKEYSVASQYAIKFQRMFSASAVDLKTYCVVNHILADCLFNLEQYSKAVDISRDLLRMSNLTDDDRVEALMHLARNLNALNKPENEIEAAFLEAFEISKSASESKRKDLFIEAIWFQRLRGNCDRIENLRKLFRKQEKGIWSTKSSHYLNDNLASSSLGKNLLETSAQRGSLKKRRVSQESEILSREKEPICTSRYVENKLESCEPTEVINLYSDELQTGEASTLCTQESCEKKISNQSSKSQNSSPTQCLEETKTAHPTSIRILVDNQVFLIPISGNNRAQTVQWLKEEAARRYLKIYVRNSPFFKIQALILSII